RRGGALRPGHSEALAADDPAHVPPAGQRPHRARQHDQETADANEDKLRNDTGQEQAYADHESDRSLDHAALVVDARVLRPHGLGKLRIVGIERLLDLLELTLLVLRERHCASHEPLARGRVRLPWPHGVRIPPQYEGSQAGERVAGGKATVGFADRPRGPGWRRI